MAEMSLLTRSRASDPALRFALHLPDGAAKASVLLTHGYADHQGRFHHVVSAWKARGIAVATWDLRGHGVSEGPRGHIEAFHDYVRDLLEMLDHLATEPAWSASGAPILFGHSLGGLITFHAALAAPERARAVVLTAPMFGLAMPVPLYKRIPARVLSGLVPRLSMPSGLSGKDVTRDEAEARAYDEDPMVFPHATARWFTESMRAQVSALQRAPELKLPLIALLAGADRVVSTRSARNVLAAVSSDKRVVKVLDGFYHEILNDPGREEWIAFLAEQMLAL